MQIHGFSRNQLLCSRLTNVNWWGLFYTKDNAVFSVLLIDGDISLEGKLGLGKTIGPVLIPIWCDEGASVYPQNGVTFARRLFGVPSVRAPKYCVSLVNLCSFNRLLRRSVMWKPHKTFYLRAYSGGWVRCVLTLQHGVGIELISESNLFACAKPVRPCWRIFLKMENRFRSKHGRDMHYQ